MTCTRAALAFGLAALLVIPWASFAQPTNAVDSLQTRYETMRQKIDAEALAAYSNVLVAVGNQLKQKADLAGYTILKAEQRFIAEKQVLPEGPDRTNLVGKLPGLDAPLSKIEASRNAKIVNLLKQYIPALEAQLRQLMIAEKLDEAAPLQNAMEAAKTELAGIESKLPKNEVPTGKSTMSAKKFPSAPKECKVDAYSPVGTVIGTCKKGDKISVQYVSGRWSCIGPEMVNPDKVSKPHYEAVIALRLEDKAYRLCTIPTGSSATPFMYECDKDGKYCIRIDDSDNLDWYGDNSGSVRYRVTIEQAQSKD